ncbi:hypothetical protein OAA09_00540 [bacterium]|nr:hypothetical protein [bacterium]
MSYITKEMVHAALSRMKSFHDKQLILHEEFGIDFTENTGRRNIIMSAAQEKFFANEIASHFPDAVNDGKTGQPDIVIPSMNKELECKITTRRSKGGYSFQTDYETLRKKGSLDYLYVLASPDFNEFAVLFFEGLTIEDFLPPASGSRGKSQMKKSVGMKKAHVLHGDVKTINDIQITKQSVSFFNAAMSAYQDAMSSNKKIFACSPTAIRKKERLQEGLEKRMNRHSKKMQDIIDKTNYWQSTDSKYKFILDAV